MLSTALSYLNTAAVAGALCLVVGIVFSQKIKDFFSGVPTELRTALSGVETKAKADIKNATSDVLRGLPVPAPAAPAAPVAPPAPVVAAPAAPVAPPPAAPAA